MGLKIEVAIAPKNGDTFTRQTPDRDGFINFIRECRIASITLKRER